MSIRQRFNRNLKKLEKPFETYNRITVSRSALLHNFDYLQSQAAGNTIFPVLKSNAYGHGLEEVATILKDRHFPYVAVDGFYESLRVRSVSKQPVLVMGAIRPDNFKRMTFKGLTFVVHDLETLQALGATKGRVKIHLEIDTGMTRHGIAIQDLAVFLHEVKKYKNLLVEGVMSHLADADNPKNDSYTERQVKLFDDCIELIMNAGFKPKYFHIAQSGGSAKVVSKYANAVRPGIALYGINPLEETDKNYRHFTRLKPVLSLVSTITKVIEVPKGTTVSYGRTYRASKDTKIGVLPLGYYEGVKRELSNKGFVKHQHTLVPIAGRVCMNHTMIDLYGVKAKRGDEVIIISNDVRSEVSVRCISKTYGLFNYSLLTGLNENIRRVITK